MGAMNETSHRRTLAEEREDNKYHSCFSYYDDTSKICREGCFKQLSCIKATKKRLTKH